MSVRKAATDRYNGKRSNGTTCPGFRAPSIDFSCFLCSRAHCWSSACLPSVTVRRLFCQAVTYTHVCWICAHACSKQANAVAENYEKVEHVWGNECKENPKCTNDCLDDCIPQPGFRVDLNEVKRVALFHYVTRYSMPNSEPFRFFDVSLAIVQHTAQTSAFRNLFIISKSCLLYTSPSPRDRTRSRMPSSA